MASDYIALIAITFIVVCALAIVACVVAVIWHGALALQIALTVLAVSALIVGAMIILTYSGIFE